MSYTIGVSSGWWKIPKSPDLLGLAQKVAGFGATVGVRFIQADVETTSEFFEPRLKEQMKRIKKEMGMDVGLHAEVGELMSLESAERRLWEQSHLRLVETVKNAADLGLKYIVVHMASRPQLIFLEAQYRVTGYFHPVVGYDGEALWKMCDKNDKTKELAIRHLRGSVGRIALDESEKGQSDYDKWANKIYQDAVEAEFEKLSQRADYVTFRKAMDARADYMENQAREVAQGKARSEINEKQATKFYEIWKETSNAQYLTDAAEITAYMLVAEYMKQTNDSIWSSICGESDIEKAYSEKHPEFNAACAVKYIEGHLTVSNRPENKKHLDGMSIVEYLKKHDVILAIEVPEAHEGYEGLMRVFNPLDISHMISKLGTQHVKLCIDFEHMISHKLRPEDVIKKLNTEQVAIVHVSKPIPYGGTAHIPIAIGSKGQEILYEWLYAMRQRGFKDGYIIFERGGGRTGAGKSAGEVMETSVWAIRQIVSFLEKNIPPEDLPPEFYGISMDNKPSFSRQMISMREHAWDPLEGLLTIPEEKHTFLSRAAVEKQKAELWEKRRFR